jgi:hypothetical protein
MAVVAGGLRMPIKALVGTRRVVVLMSLVAAMATSCHIRRGLRVIVRLPLPRTAALGCVMKAFGQSSEWDVKSDASGSTTVFAKPPSAVYALSLLAEDGPGSTTISFAAVLREGEMDVPGKLRELEQRGRSAAEVVAKSCAPTAKVTCWDSESRVENERCYP